MLLKINAIVAIIAIPISIRNGSLIADSKSRNNSIISPVEENHVGIVRGFESHD